MRIKNYLGSGHIHDEDANRIGSFLDSKFGDLAVTATEIVVAARPARSPIHRDFEWDDAVAGDQFRLEQARQMLRSIKVVFVNGHESVPTRAYHQVTVVEADQEQHRVYMPAQVVWQTPELASQVTEKALAELRGWVARYRSYKQFSGLAEGIGQMILELAEQTV